jgi:hypothetical protein
MKKILAILITLFSLNSFSQAPTIDWAKCIGGTSSDYANSIQQTTDGGYIIAGIAQSNDGDVSGNNGLYDIWVVKLNATGSLLWQKCIGGTDNDEARKIQQTSDGGYIIAGFTWSIDGDVSGNNGSEDLWVIKLNAAGNILWQKCIGGTNSDRAYSIQQTIDGGYIVAGTSESNNVDVIGNNGGSDLWVVRLNATGSLLWQKCLGGTNSDRAYSIQQTTDGGYIVAGFTTSNNGDVIGHNGDGGDLDAWIVKLNTDGSLLWQKCLGGTENDQAHSIQQTTDGGYIVSGSTGSNDGNVSGYNGGSDVWVVKLNTAGSLVWQKCLGGTDYEQGLSIQQTSDSGYIVAGFTGSNDGDVVGAFDGTGDVWVLKLNSIGNLVWQKCLGGTDIDGANSIQQTIDGGFIVAGYTWSNDGDVEGFNGTHDIWVVKLNATLSLVENEGNEKEFELYPNPTNGKVTLKVNDQFNPQLVTIKNSNGQILEKLTVSKNTSNEFEIELNAENGIYFIAVFDGENTITKKVIKN